MTQRPDIWTLHTSQPGEGESQWGGCYIVEAHAHNDAVSLREATGMDWTVVPMVRADRSAQCLHQIAEPAVQAPDEAQIKALMRKHRIWVEHSTLFEDDEPERELRAVQAEEHQFNAFVQDLIAATQLAAAPQAVQVTGDLGLATLEKYLKECDENQIVPDVGGAFAYAWQRAAAPQAVQASAPVGTKFFSFDPCDDLVVHDTAEAACAAAQQSIDLYREDAAEGWAEEVERVCWGMILGQALETKLSEDLPPAAFAAGAAGSLPPVDYVLQAPAHPAEGVPEQAAQGMTAERASYFMRRFLKEEKLLGPNEQAAMHYVISLLAATQPAAQGMDADGMYYLQDARHHAMVGNCPSFWRPDGNGYTTNLDEAARFTFEDAMQQHQRRKTDLPWLCSEVDKLRRPTVDCQDMPRSWDAQRAALAAQAKQGGANHG